MNCDHDQQTATPPEAQAQSLAKDNVTTTSSTVPPCSWGACRCGNRHPRSLVRAIGTLMYIHDLTVHNKIVPVHVQDFA